MKWTEISEGLVTESEEAAPRETVQAGAGETNVAREAAETLLPFRKAQIFGGEKSGFMRKTLDLCLPAVQGCQKATLLLSP